MRYCPPPALARVAALSPFHQWTVGAPPLQMVCSTQRADQPCAQAKAMARHVRSQGGRAEVLPQPLSHGGAVACLQGGKHGWWAESMSL